MRQLSTKPCRVTCPWPLVSAVPMVYAVGLAVSVFTPVSQTARAQTWNLPVNGNWSQATNWVGNLAPVSGPTTALTFDLNIGDGPYTATNDVANPFVLNSLSLNNFTGTNTLTLNSSPTNAPLRFEGTTPTIALDGIGPVAINAVVQVPTTLTIAGPGSSTLTLANGVSGTGTLVVNTNPAATVRLGNITNGFGGNLDIQSGTVQANSTTGTFLSTATTVNVAAAAVLNLNNNGENIAGLTGAGNVLLGTGSLILEGPANNLWSGTISGTGLVTKLNSTGNSTLTWTGNNSYTGNTSIQSGTLRLADDGRLSGTTLVSLDRGAALILDNTAAINSPDRINDAATVRMIGGATSLQFLGAAAANSTETIGTLTLQTSPNPSFSTVVARVISQAGPNAGTATLTLNTLNRTVRGSVVTFEGSGSVVLTNATLLNGILGGWATIANDWATTSGPSGGVITPLATYQTATDPNSWVAADNVRIASALTASRAASGVVNSLNFAAAQTLTLDPAATLTLGSGGLLASANAMILGGTLTSSLSSTTNFNDLIVRVNGPAANLTISSALSNNGMPSTALTKVGQGTLTLTSPDTIGIGNLFVREGAIVVDAGSAGGNLNAVSFSGAGSFIKTGSGTLSLLGSSGITTSAIFLNQGTLVSSPQSAATNIGDASGLYIAAGATWDTSLDNVENLGGLAGTGRVVASTAASSVVTVFDFLAPGNPAPNISATGPLTFEGDIRFGPSSVFEVDLAGTAPGQFDQLLVLRDDGRVEMQSGATILVNLLSGYLPNPGDTFTLIDNQTPGAIVGVFSNAPAGPVSLAGLDWIISYTGGDGNDLTLTAVPEPGAMAALAVAMFAASWAARRRTR